MAIISLVLRCEFHEYHPCSIYKYIGHYSFTLCLWGNASYDMINIFWGNSDLDSGYCLFIIWIHVHYLITHFNSSIHSQAFLCICTYIHFFLQFFYLNLRFLLLYNYFDFLLIPYLLQFFSFPSFFRLIESLVGFI